MADTPLVRPVTSTGTSDWVLVPLPSWPLRLLPQHLTPPLVVRAQVWLSPAAIAATPLVRPVTSTGDNEAVVELLPSCPVVLSPQHLMPLAEVIAEVWLLPAASREPSGVGAGGVVVVVVVVVEVVEVVDVVDVVEVVDVDVVLVVEVVDVLLVGTVVVVPPGVAGVQAAARTTTAARAAPTPYRTAVARALHVQPLQVHRQRPRRWFNSRNEGDPCRPAGAFAHPWSGSRRATGLISGRGSLRARACGAHYLSPPDMGGTERDLLLAAFESNWIAPSAPRWMPSRPTCAPSRVPRPPLRW